MNYSRRVCRDQGSSPLAAGAMVNTGLRSAVGGAVPAAVDTDGHRIGVQGRFRRWLHGPTAVDLTPVLFVEVQRNGAIGARSAAIGLALTRGDLIGVALNYQLAGGAGRLYAGVRLGSWMTPVGLAGLVAAMGTTYN